MRGSYNALSGSPSRILIRGVNWLGDAIMTTPALLRVRERYPGAHIALLTLAKLAGLWEKHPAINSVQTFAASESVFAVAQRLRAERYDTGLILPNSFRSALELCLARIPIRIGYGGRGRSWLLTSVVERSADAVSMRKRSDRDIRRLVGMNGASGWDAAAHGKGAVAHHIHQYLRLAAGLHASDKPTAPRIHIDPDEARAALVRFGIDPASQSQLLCLNAGAEYGPAKRWPLERFVSAACEIRNRTGCRWVVLGGTGDLDIAASVVRGLGEAPPAGASAPAAVSLAGQTSLRELCAVLSACRLLLTNDTGPMHVAAALGTPVVVPFGSTSPELTGPGLPGDSTHRVLCGRAACAPCFRRNCPIDFRCMQSITVAAVVQAVLECLARGDLVRSRTPPLFSTNER